MLVMMPCGRRTSSVSLYIVINKLGVNVRSEAYTPGEFGHEAAGAEWALFVFGAFSGIEPYRVFLGYCAIDEFAEGHDVVFAVQIQRLEVMLLRTSESTVRPTNSSAARRTRTGVSLADWVGFACDDG